MGIPFTKKSIHVFASDFLPFPGCPRTAGGNRSWQLISALRAAGHDVTFSMPLTGYLAKLNGEKILKSLTDEELWCCEHFFEPELVLNRVAPDIAVYCTVHAFRTIHRFAKDIVHIVDFYGPVQLEGLLVDADDCEKAMADGPLLEARCRDVVERLRHADYLVTVSERQKYFWLAYCSLAGFSFRDLKILLCPASWGVHPVCRSLAPQMTIVYSGGFYPWQQPDRALRFAAEALDCVPGATLHIFGGPHAGASNERDVYKLLGELQQHRSVQYHGYRPIEELTAALSTAWCALELMDQNLERELAITGRTLEFLSTGTPVIYNDYSTLSELIRRYEAGWTISPSDANALKRVIDEIARGGPGLVTRYSENAKRLAANEFKPATSMAPLIDLCNGPLRKRESNQSRSRNVKPRAENTRIGSVLAICPGVGGALAELRVNNPLRGLQRQHLIGGYRISGTSFEHLNGDPTLYEVILIQRAVPEYIYWSLRNLGLPFILDVDDNLLARASYRNEPTEPHIATGLQHATVVTVPNPRIVHLLEKYSAISIRNKACITPNSLPYAPTPREPSQPSQICWIQSDIAALTNSLPAVVNAVETFSTKYQLPVILVGRNVLNRPQFKYQVEMGEIDFTANLQLLELGPMSIGVAPLETEADAETLDFVAGKSDLKMLLFGGYGHPGVYSAAPPYADSALRECGSVIGNSCSEWKEALEFQFREGWRSMTESVRYIQTTRHCDRIARESWFPALDACALPKPISGAELYEAFTAAAAMGVGADGRLTGGLNGRLTVTSADAGPRVGNEDQRWHARTLELERELANLRASYSWKVTEPLRKLAKPFLENRGNP